ncbi:MAG TPA: hypothetical protein ENH89_03610, partial [Aurantimonas coralicida]|nr:hypothetical protein [Aurantimonas coralicida]
MARFDDISIGAQLMRTYTMRGWRGGIDDTSGPPTDLSQQTWYYIVTDLWFDPVKGDTNPKKGQMVGVRRLNGHGEAFGRKQGHTRRGLASNGFHYADRDYISECKAFLAAKEEGKVVGIGMGLVLRQRP